MWCAAVYMQAGSDVITRTAHQRINWSSYKINQGTDKVWHEAALSHAQVQEARDVLGG